jgi:hypothetical protein
MARKQNAQEAVVAISSKEATSNNTHHLNKQWPWIKKHKGSAAK